MGGLRPFYMPVGQTHYLRLHLIWAMCKIEMESVAGFHWTGQGKIGARGGRVMVCLRLFGGAGLDTLAVAVCDTWVGE